MPPADGRQGDDNTGAEAKDELDSCEVERDSSSACCSSASLSPLSESSSLCSSTLSSALESEPLSLLDEYDALIELDELDERGALDKLDELDERGALDELDELDDEGGACDVDVGTSGFDRRGIGLTPCGTLSRRSEADR